MMKKKTIALMTVMMMGTFSAGAVGVPLCQPLGLHTWNDAAMAAATMFDYAATQENQEKHVDAKDAIEKLEKSLKGNGGQGSSNGGCSASPAVATIYTDDHIRSVIENSENAEPKTQFDTVRTAVKEYLFETPELNGQDCQDSDKDCAVLRQNEWLLASVTLASATADKVLAQTAKQNVKDGRTDAERSEDDDETEDSTGGGGTPLTGHFKQLANQFNAAKAPADLYNAMAAIVLDTHRQSNDANALMGRDLEAQGLRVINETGTIPLAEGTGEG